MIVPFADLKAQYAAIRGALQPQIAAVLESQRFVLGPEVAAFEEEMAAYCGFRFAVGMSSGTDALMAALMAAEVEPGDEVVTSCYSFFATAGAIARLGARPVFADIDPWTFAIDAQAAVDAITARTRAIIPVHLFGGWCEMDPILKVAQEHEIVIVEDAAQGVGAGEKAPSGEIQCLSFFPTKVLGGFGDGGMAMTDDPQLAGALRTLRVQGADPKYHHRVVGGNFRLDELQAAVLRVKLKYLDGWIEQRRVNARRYRELFAETRLADRVFLPEHIPGHTYSQFVIRVPQRDGLREYLESKDIGTEVYYPVPLHLQECFTDLGYRPGDLPQAEACARESLALPIYPELSPQQQEFVVGAIQDFFAA